MEVPGFGVRGRALSSKRIVAALLLLVFAGLAGGGWLFLTQERRLKQQAEDDLATIARFKIEQIENWRRERLGDAATASESPFFIHGVKRFLQDAGADDARRLRQRFDNLKAYYRYSNVVLIGPDKQILLTSRENDVLGPELLAALDLARTTGKPLLTDIHTPPGGDAVHLDVVAPLFEGDAPTSPFLGWLVLQTPASQFLYPLLQTWPIHSRTAETLLIRRDGDAVVFLNPLRHRQGAPLTLRIPLGDTATLAVKAILGARGLVRGVDYRNVDVLGVVLAVPGTPWLLVAKMDSDEVYAAWRQQALYILTLMGCLLAGGVVVALLLRQHGLKAYYRTLFEAEAKLRDSLELQAVTLGSIGDAVIATDIEGRVTLFNAAAERLTGWPGPEAMDRPLAEVFHIINEQTREPQDNPLAEVLATGRPVELAAQTLLVASDATECPIADSAAPIRDGRGELVGMVLIFRDNSAERQVRLAKDALSRSREDLKRAQAVAMTGNWRLDVTTGNLDWSDESYRIFGIVPGTVMALERFMDCVHPDDRSMVQQHWEAALGGERYEVEHRIMVDGEVKWVRERGVLEWDEAGTLHSGFGVVQDITEHKHFERLKALNAARSKALLELAELHDITPDALTQAVLDKAVALTESAFGYLHFVASDQVHLHLMHWSTGVGPHCQADRLAHYPLSAAGIWADCLRTGHPALHNDYAGAAGRGGLPQGHIPLFRHLSIPVAEGEGYGAVLGVGNKHDPYDALDIYKLQSFVAGAWQILSRRKAEAALRESEAFSRTIIENSPDCIKMLGRQGELVFMSQGGLRLLGLSDFADVAGKPYLDFWQGQDAERARAAYEEARQGRVGRFEGYCPTLGGTPKWWDVSISALPGPQGEAGSFLVISRDDTQRKLAVDALRESEERFRQLVENAPDAIFVQIDGQFAYVNKACLELYGIASAEDMLGTSILARYNPDFRGHVLERIRALQERKQAMPPMEQLHQRLNGNPLDVEVSAVPLCYGGKDGAVVFVRDIAERKRLETLREDMDRIARHDLKTPLNAILGLPQLLLLDDNLTAEQRQHLHYIQDSGYKMLGLVNLSLDLFRMERGTYELVPQHVDLLAVVGKALADLEQMRSAKALVVRRSLDGHPATGQDTCPVRAEELLCYALFSNLLKNAQEASPRGGAVTVDFARDQADWRIDIHNQGEVPAALRDRFFDKYATMGKVGGTGLGTYSAQLMAATMGGRIALDTAHVGATTVSVWLPAVD